MKAIILAAGQGTRLRPLTDDRPKCLVELEGRSLLARQLAVLESAGIDDVVIVGGYRADMLQGFGGRVVRNDRFEQTNMVHTLFCARDEIEGEDVVVAYGDIVYELRVLRALMASDAAIAVTVDRLWHRYWSLRMSEPLSDAETLVMDEERRLVELGRKPTSLEQVQAQYMGLFKVRADRTKLFRDFYDSLPREADYDGKSFPNMYMTSFLQRLIDSGWDVRAIPVDGGWLELDTVDDLDLYRRLAQQGTLDELCRLDPF